MLFIEYPKCTTCQKAKKWLDENDIEYEDRHIKENNPTYDELKKWYRQSGMPLKRFFNTSGLLYKSMQLKDKLPDMTEEEQLQLLATDGMLVKRPIVIADGAVVVGFREKEWEEKLKNNGLYGINASEKENPLKNAKPPNLIIESGGFFMLTEMNIAVSYTKTRQIHAMKNNIFAV